MVMHAEHLAIDTSTSYVSQAYALFQKVKL